MANIPHIERAHAYLSASSAHRWLFCPPIVALEADKEDRQTSYTLEGTAAHELSEIKLKRRLRLEPRSTNTKALNAFRKNNEYYSKELDQYTDEYVETVMEHINRYTDPIVTLEERVDFSRWVPEGFGTADVIILSDGVLEVIDLKYGKGYAVSANQNPQMGLYALGAYGLYDMLYDIDTVRMTIVQPRLDTVSTFELSAEELLYWADNYVAPRAVQAIEGIGEWEITSDVVKFSKVRAQVVARAAKNLEFIEHHGLADEALLDDDDIAEILKMKSEVEKWLKDVESYAMSEALKGKKFAGWKLVEGRSNRKIADPQAAAEALKEAGFADVFKPEELKTLGDLEKMVGKKDLATILGNLIVKPEGKPVLVPLSDKRTELNSLEAAVEEFGDWAE